MNYAHGEYGYMLQEREHTATIASRIIGNYMADLLGSQSQQFSLFNFNFDSWHRMHSHGTRVFQFYINNHLGRLNQYYILHNSLFLMLVKPPLHIWSNMLN